MAKRWSTPVDHRWGFHVAHPDVQPWSFTRTMKRGFVLLVAILFHSEITVATVSGVDVSREERSLMEKIIAVHRERESTFDNMHAVWTQAAGMLDEQPMVWRFEYWSREGRFFRYERRYVSGPLPPDRDPPAVLRAIVRPDGYVDLKATEDDELGTITELGPPEEGVERLKHAGWFCQANNLEGRVIHEALSGWLSGDDEYKRVSVRKQDETVVVELDWESRGDNVSEVCELSADDFRILQSTFHVVSEDGRSSTKLFTREYGDQQTDVPVAHGVTAEMDFYRFTLDECQFAPAAMEVFYPQGLPAREGGRVWIRRLVTLVVGLILIAVYFRYRRTTRADSPIAES